MANTMTVDQVSTVLREVLAQATGRTDLAALDSAQLITVGQQALNTAYDPVINAISQVISRTIFSMRPYRRKFGSIRMDELSWGNAVRKLTLLEDPQDLQDNQYLPLPDDGSVDHYKIHKPKAMELRFIGQQTYQVVKTIFRVQLNTAFYNANEFGQFISMVFTYVYNKLEKLEEEIARATVSGFIAGKVAADTVGVESGNVIHLLSEYQEQTGISGLTSQSIYAPENFGPFMKWVYGRVAGISELMTEYSTKFHTNLTEGDVLRHTPKEEQRCYLFAPTFFQTTSQVLADTYHETFLRIPGAEMVNFWQNIDSPDSISVEQAQYLGADGTLSPVKAPLLVSKVFGVIFDREALGYNPVLQDSLATPINAAGKYYNMFWHVNFRSYNDFTENAVVFLMD